jgi:hypothetical protein
MPGAYNAVRIERPLMRFVSGFLPLSGVSGVQKNALEVRETPRFSVEEVLIIPRDLCCKATCCACYPLQLCLAGCTLHPGVCSRVYFSKTRDPYSQFQEAQTAIETLERFLASS